MYLPILCSWAALVATPPEKPAGPDAREVIAKAKAQRAAIETAEFKVSWENVKEGKLVSWEEQTFYWDNLKRRRIIAEAGPFDAQGKRAYPADRAIADTTYDGEVVINRKGYFARDRVGRELKAAANEVRYNAVIVGDGQSPLRKSLEAHRNPMTYLRDIAIRDVDAALAAGKPVTVRTPDPKQKVYTIGFPEVRPAELPYSRHEVVVDGERGWSVTSLKSFDAKGKLMRTIDFDYRPSAGGTWAPVKGVHTHWGNRAVTETPFFEWRFTASVARFNDPKFDQGVFKVQLAPDTAVSDTRYNVSYRVGGDKAAGDELAHLAQQAKDDEAANPRTGALRKRGKWWWVWVTATALLGLGVAGRLAYTRLRAQPAAA